MLHRSSRTGHAEKAYSELAESRKLRAAEHLQQQGRFFTDRQILHDHPADQVFCQFCCSMASSHGRMTCERTFPTR